jgi:hypothetical protein
MNFGKTAGKSVGAGSKTTTELEYYLKAKKNIIGIG